MGIGYVFSILVVVVFCFRFSICIFHSNLHSWNFLAKERSLCELAQTRTGNAAGFLIHSEIHKARPDIHAVCHAHTNAGRAWSTFARGLDMLNQDICTLYDSIAVYADYGGIVFAAEEGKNIAKALGMKNKVRI